MTIPTPSACSRMTNQQLAAMTIQPGRWSCVEAGAGAGKTQVLASRVVLLLEQWPTPQARIDQIVALTFTRKAAAEMASRVQRLLEARILELEACDSADITDEDRDGALTRLRFARENFHRHRIGTIDSFCRSVLASYALEAGVEPGFGIADERQSLRVRVACLERLRLRWSLNLHGPEQEITAEARAYATLFDLLSERAVHGLLTSLLANASTLQPLFDAWNNFASDSDIDAYVESVSTLVRSEFEKQLHDSGLLAELQHYSAACVLAAKNNPEHGRAVNVVRILAALQSGDPWSFEPMPMRKGKQSDWGHFEIDQTDVTRVVKDFMGLIGEFVCDPEAERRSALGLRAASVLVPAMRDAYRENMGNDFDFADVREHAIALLETQEVVTEVARGIHWLMIDEFQDTDPGQWQLVQQLTAANPAMQVFVVGDSKQSIYRFRNADVRIFALAREAVLQRQKKALPPVNPWRGELIPAVDAVLGTQLGEQAVNGVYTMNANFRSFALPLTLGNALFQRVFGLLNEENEPARPLELHDAPPGDMLLVRPLPEVDPHEGRRGCVKLLPYLAKGLETSEGINEGESGVEGESEEALYSLLREDLEARLLCEELVKEHEAGMRWGDMAVLVPKHSRIPPLKRAFMLYSIPWQVSGVRALFETTECFEVQALLHMLADPCDDLHAIALLRSSLIGLTDDSLALLALERKSRKLPSLWALLGQKKPVVLPDADRLLLEEAMVWLHGVLADAGRVPLKTLIRKALIARGVFAHATDASRLQQHANWRKLIQLVDELSADVGHEPGAVAEALREAIDRGDQEEEGSVEAGSDAVQVMTIHAAKGKEFRLVAPCFLDSGTGGFSPTLDWSADQTIHCTDGVQRPLLALRTSSFRGGGSRDPLPFISTLIKTEDKTQELAERRRLLYVAWTRAIETIILPIHVKEYSDSSSAKHAGQALQPESARTLSDVLLAGLGVSNDVAHWDGKALGALRKHWIDAAAPHLNTPEGTAVLDAGLIVLPVHEPKPMTFGSDAAIQERLHELALLEANPALPHFEQLGWQDMTWVQERTPDPASAQVLSTEFEIGEASGVEPLRQLQVLAANDYGTLVHALIEAGVSGQTVNMSLAESILASQMFTDAPSSQISKEMMSDIKLALAEAERSLKVLTAIGDSRRRFVELEIGMLDPDPRQRCIDFCEELQPGHWRIIDFKTGRMRSEYRQQLQGYALGLHLRLALQGEALSAVETFVMSTHDGQMHAMDKYERQELETLAAQRTLG